MLANFAIYIKHGFGFRKAFRYAFGITVRDFIINAVLLGLILALLTGLCIKALELIDAGQQQQSAEQAAYKKTVESILDACLSDATGRPITIDGEVYLCGIVPTGVKI